ncbi:tRNA (adenosine(37)-N6)-threonylcarbamoyltransferase complex dimerization subunit type 1 TsaB [Saccharibacillus sp. O16]|nr:tRNA (adenosine(37)-N6)-threonylcarbamoyltransferase complex dimerization subunit type 1 TsaB [Saccharibacillus sp. O16]
MEKHNRSQGRILALDTSSAAQAVAVIDESGVRFESNSLAERNHSVNLLPEIERALRESGTDKRELAGIAVGIGPGSYTGVRIAVTTAKTLAWALKLPVAAVSSLEAQAASGLEAAAPQGRGWIVPLVDARRGQAYTALFAAPGAAAGSAAASQAAPGKAEAGTESPAQAESPSAAAASAGSAAQPMLERLADDAILLVGDWTAAIAGRLKELPAAEQPDYILFTGETAKHAETVLALAELAGISPERVRLQDCAAEGRWIGAIGARKLAAGEASEPHSLLPNYTQVTEAEANLLRRDQA